MTDVAAMDALRATTQIATVVAEAAGRAGLAAVAALKQVLKSQAGSHGEKPKPFKEGT